MENRERNLFGPGGQPISNQRSIVVIKSRYPLPQQLIQQVGMVTNSTVIALPFGIDLLMGNLAIEDIEAIHAAIHKILEIGEPEPPKTK